MRSLSAFRAFVPGALLLTILSRSAFGQTAASLDAQVQAPEIRAPQRGSLVGQLASIAFGPADVSRGAFSLPSPFTTPSERGGLLGSAFPVYSPDSGISEWGMGWQVGWAFTRWRVVGDLDYRTDELTGPWGRFVRGADGFWYPVGLSSLIRLEVAGDTLIAYLQDGSRWRFGGPNRIVTPKGTYAWLLTEVETPLGRRSRFEYDQNASGRRFLKAVSYGGVGSDFQYQVQLAYETLDRPFRDLRSGQEMLLDRRVKTVQVLAKHSRTGSFAERWRYTLTYQSEAPGPAFYLVTVAQTFSSGEQAPPVRYAYHFTRDNLNAAQLMPMPAMEPVIRRFGVDIIQPSRSAMLDVERDGQPELEDGESNILVTREKEGFAFQQLPPTPPEAFPFCRRAPSPLNPPRLLVQLRATENVYRVLHLRRDALGTETALSICDRDGRRLEVRSLPGDWDLGSNVRLVDMNRDHQPDLVRVSRGGYQILPNTSTPAGYGFGTPRRGALQPAFNPDTSWVHDFNGDGLADLISRFSGGLVVWFGRGNFEFVQPGRTFTLRNALGTPLSRLSEHHFTFVDSNKDGLTDLVLTRTSNNSANLFINDGTAFQEAPVPGLRAVDAFTSRPVVADLSGSGNTELTYTRNGQVFALALDGPETGLMRNADDGRGTVARFAYRRAPPFPGQRQRHSVLIRLEIDSSGYDSALHEYEYQSPTFHSLGQFLIGFDQVIRRGSQDTETLDLLNEDNHAGLFLSSKRHDSRFPEVVMHESRRYDDIQFHGITSKRLRESVTGWQSTGPVPNPGVVERTEYLAYTKDVCASAVQRTGAQGVLLTEVQFASLPRFDKHLACQEERVIEKGQHAEAGLDFRHETVLTRNTVGLVQKVQSLAPEGPLTLQEVKYGPTLDIESLTLPGRGTSSFSYAPGSQLLRQVRLPDGVEIEVSARDPLTDAILSLSTLRGKLAYHRFFRFDGRERLKSQWDNLGGASEELPSSQFVYREATVEQPGLVFRTELIDAAARSTRDHVDFETAAGEPITTARRIPEGWTFGELLARSRIRVETTGHLRPLLPFNTDLASVSHAELFSGAERIHSTTGSSFGTAASTLTRFYPGVERRIEVRLTLKKDRLIQSSQENGTFSTTSELDAAKRVLSFVDEAGTAYRYRYDSLGRLREIRLPDGKVHRVSYDGHGRIRRIEREELATIEYDYHSTTGLLMHKRYLSASGVLMRQVDSTYDAAGRILEEVHSAPTGPPLRFRYFYDGATPDQPEARHAVGLLTAVAGEGFARHFEYRPDGSLLRRRVIFPGWRTVETELAYFESGNLRLRLTRLQDDAGAPLSSSTFRYGYDAWGRLSAVELNGQPFTQLTYDENNQLQSARYASGERVLLAYDPLSRRFEGATHEAGTWTASSRSRMNARGLIQSDGIRVGTLSLTRRYDYSPQGFLKKSSDAQSTYAYAFDPSGLPVRIEENGMARELVRTGETLMAGGVLYRFDELGRVIQRGELELVYGPDNQLRTARSKGQEWRLVYDEAGQRLAKWEGSTPVAAYLEDGVYLDAQGLSEPVRVGNKTVGLLTNGRFRLIATDIRGTVLAELDGTPRLASPFGDRAVRPSVAKEIDYAQKGFDPDLGLIRMGGRDYDPETGRFLSPDPFLLEAPQHCVDRPVECNLYAYAGGNPVSQVDPSGQYVETAWDVASLGMGIASIAQWNASTTFGAKALDVVGVVADGVAIAIPIIPGGVGALLKGARVAEKVTETVRAAGIVADPVRAVEKASDTAHAAKGAVNIDTGTAAAFISQGSALRHELKTFVGGRSMVMTETAAKEFEGVLRVAGPEEAARAQRFLERVSIVSDNPSARALGLNVTKSVGANDIRVFGTGDRMGITTMTSDAKFLRGAAAQGVNFDAFLHAPVPLLGL